MIRTCNISSLSTLYYREIPLHADRPVRLDRQRGVQQIPDGPDPIRQPKRDRWRGSQGLMDAAEIVVADLQADRRDVVIQLL